MSDPAANKSLFSTNHNNMKDIALALGLPETATEAEIIAAGFDAAAVQRVVKLIDGAEYKRRQAAPGLKVTTKAFGVGRRIPIAQRWREVS